MHDPAIQRITVNDFLEIRQNIDHYWGNARTLHLHHPMFVHEFGDTAYCIRDDQQIMAYMFGFLAQTSPTAYVHLIAVHKDQQKKGFGKKLYHHFQSVAHQKGCTNLKSITTPTNSASIAFHESMGMTRQLMENYAGVGEDRVVFTMAI